ncbi:class F sortase [Nocardioides sp. Bht2]|uniref:class F sortase n=1 Tax=Nocardioides sp. Bht2 TaxID=3392297 RepID=UPI0039B37453
MSSPPARRVGAVIAALVGTALFVPAPTGAAAGAPPSSHTCETSATAFRPKVARFSSVRRKFDVVRVARTPSGAIGTPPLTARGKRLVGWDPHTKPANGRGSVILDAHTWPGGGALGNTLLRKLRRGDVITLDSAGRKKACYRVTERRSYPVKRFPQRKAFRSWGKEQVVIVVCSGKRLGPGRWTHRTVWYAVPITGDDVSATPRG